MTPISFKLDEIDSTAAALLSVFANEHVFALNGAMGAGKTTLISALCRHLGVQDHPSSPTFSLINQYQTASGEVVYHIDLYRLKDAGEARAAGIEDALYSGRHCFVEWPSIAPEVFPPNTLCINITLLPGGERQLAFSKMD